MEIYQSIKIFLKVIWLFIGKKFNHKLFIFLNKFGITPKIEIRFLSNSNWIKSSNNYLSLKKFLLKLFQFSYAKELMSINSRAYDLFKEQKLKISNKYIVLLEEFFDDPQYIEIRGYTDKKKLKVHYENLIQKLEALSDYYKKEVIVCLHPSDNLKTKKKYFQNLKLNNLKPKNMFTNQN